MSIQMLQNMSKDLSYTDKEAISLSTIVNIYWHGLMQSGFAIHLMRLQPSR